MYEIYKRFLSLNLKDYENIGIDLEIGIVLFALAVGLIIAAIFISIQRNTMTSLVKRLTRADAIDEDRAKTLSELGFTGFWGFVCQSILKGSGRLKRLVLRVGQKEYTYEEYIDLSKKKKGKKNEEENGSPRINPNEKTDFKTARFYLKDKNSSETKNILEAANSSFLNTALFCVFVFAVYVCLTLLMPEILNFINNALAE